MSVLRLGAAIAIVITALAARGDGLGVPPHPEPLPEGEGTEHADHLLYREPNEVRTRLVLHARFTDRERYPVTQVLFDRAALAFDTARYLAPAAYDVYGSSFLSAGLDGRALDGRLRWVLTADTGELRGTAFPRDANVCFSKSSGTGLALEGDGMCQALPRVVLPAEETGRDVARLTSNGRPLATEVARTLLVREAWLGYSFGPAEFATVRAGRKRMTVGDGFIYDDYATGIEAGFDLGALGPQWDLGAALFYPTRDFPRSAGLISPMLALRADYLPSLFEHAGLFVVLYRDRTNSVAELFRSATLESSVVRLRGLEPGTFAYEAESQRLLVTLARPLESDAGFLWAGTSGSLALAKGQRLGWTGALVAGSATLRVPQSNGTVDRFDFPVLGKLASVRYRAEVGRSLSAGAFFLGLSGDLPPEEKKRLGLPQRYDGFLGIAPYITATNIFFSGGVAESFASRQATAPGVNGRGVIAPGLTAAFEPGTDFSIEARGAWLFAGEVGPYGGRVYGPEVDLNVTYAPLDWLVLAAEADVLVPGDFFGGGAPITKFVLGIDLVRM